MLRELGFWCSQEELSTQEPLDPDRQNPLQLVDDVWFAACDPKLKDKIEWYLTIGAFVESHELAYSFCRFPNCSQAIEQPKVLGACTMTDGVYCWPEGYWHYVYHHHVKPPKEFLDHLLVKYDELVETTKKAKAEKTLLLWDEVEQKAVEMPKAMQEWITNYTTIQVDP